MYEVRLSKDARAAFEAADAAFQRRLDRCFTALRAGPRRHQQIKRLHGPLSAYYRYRIGDYRVVYRIDDERQIVWVALIAHRRQAYR